MTPAIIAAIAVVLICRPLTACTDLMYSDAESGQMLLADRFPHYGWPRQAKKPPPKGRPLQLLIGLQQLRAELFCGFRRQQARSDVEYRACAGLTVFVQA